MPLALRADLAGFDLADGFLEDREPGLGLILAQDERRRDADRIVPAPEHQQPSAERRLLDRVGGVVVGEPDADHHPQATYIAGDRVPLLDVTHAVHELSA